MGGGRSKGSAWAPRVQRNRIFATKAFRKTSPGGSRGGGFNAKRPGGVYYGDAHFPTSSLVVFSILYGIMPIYPAPVYASIDIATIIPILKNAANRIPNCPTNRILGALSHSAGNVLFLRPVILTKPSFERYRFPCY